LGRQSSKLFCRDFQRIRIPALPLPKIPRQVSLFPVHFREDLPLNRDRHSVARAAPTSTPPDNGAGVGEGLVEGACARAVESAVSVGVA